MGGKPYPGTAMEELVDFLGYGGRMGQPQHCPNEVYQLMEDCWEADPVKRPSFAELRDSLQNILQIYACTVISHADVLLFT